MGKRTGILLSSIHIIWQCSGIGMLWWIAYTFVVVICQVLLHTDAWRKLLLRTTWCIVAYARVYWFFMKSIWQKENSPQFDAVFRNSLMRKTQNKTNKPNTQSFLGSEKSAIVFVSFCFWKLIEKTKKIVFFFSTKKWKRWKGLEYRKWKMWNKWKSKQPKGGQVQIHTDIQISFFFWNKIKVNLLSLNKIKKTCAFFVVKKVEHIKYQKWITGNFSVRINT